MNRQATETMFRQFEAGFREATAGTTGQERRVGAELKFPLVDETGRAVPRDTVDALWAHLVASGWRAELDGVSGRMVGARKAGERNDTVASCETGYCKNEFSLAHAGDLHDLRRTMAAVILDLRPFLDRHGVRLLTYGMHPVTPPSSDLLMKKMRAGFWDKALPSNNVISPEDGDDVHLFTVNACSHVHVSVSPEEAVRAVDVLNGFAGAQIALTANSCMPHGWARDKPYKCLNEKFWDWWEVARDRVGVPREPFGDLHGYVARVAALKPIFVKRDGRPVILCRDHETFADYFGLPSADGLTPEGERVAVEPDPDDIATHNSCYWYTARISRYYTVENRVYDQQPRDGLLAPAALTLGLVSALDVADEAMRAHSWESLRETRESACRGGMQWPDGGPDPAVLCGQLLEIAESGLRSRGKGEEAFLAPLWARLRDQRCPADAVAGAGPDWVANLLETCTL